MNVLPYRDETVEGVHAVLVAGKHDDDILLVVFHDVQEDLNRFLPIITIVRRIVQVVSLREQGSGGKDIMER